MRARADRRARRERARGAAASVCARWVVWSAVRQEGEAREPRDEGSPADGHRGPVPCDDLWLARARSPARAASASSKEEKTLAA